MILLFASILGFKRAHSFCRSLIVLILLSSLIIGPQKQQFQINTSSTIFAVAAVDNSNDLYKILGVKRSATTKEIKSAYRQKARDTHPDKNPDVDPEVAAANFHKVVQAFETLSDDHSRKMYDRTGRHHDNNNSGGSGGRGGGGGFQFHFRTRTSTRFQYQHMKHRLDVQQAQSRVMHVVSLAQLETIILDDNDLLEKSLLMCFVTPSIEKVADDFILFPYPFAGMSSQGIWWEDILQTVKIRYHRSNDIQKKFHVQHGDEMTKPTFVFVRRGQSFDESNYHTLTTASRDEFDKWVWSMLETPVKFYNNHTHSVEIYWINGNRAIKKGTIKPNEMFEQHTRFSHEWYVRDERVDKDRRRGKNLTTNSSLGMWKIMNDLDVIEPIIISTKCFDMSGECPYWSVTPSPGECFRNPNFMLTNCKRTCGICDKEEAQEKQRLEEEEKEAEYQRQKDGYDEIQRQREAARNRREKEEEERLERKQQEEPSANHKTNDEL